MPIYAAVRIRSSVASVRPTRLPDPAVAGKCALPSRGDRRRRANEVWRRIFAAPRQRCASARRAISRGAISRRLGLG